MLRFVALIFSLIINPILIVGIVVVAYMENYLYALIAIPFVTVFLRWGSLWLVKVSIWANLIIVAVMLLLVVWSIVGSGYGLGYAWMFVSIIIVGSLANAWLLSSNKNV